MAVLAQSPANQFIAYMRSIDTFLEAQSGIPGIDSAAIREANSVSLTARVHQLPPMNAGELADIIRAIGEGMWTTTQKARLGAAIGAMQPVGLLFGGCRTGARKLQILLNPEKYAPERVWRVIDNTDEVLSQKIHALAAFYHDLCCWCPSEISSRHAVSLVIHWGCKHMHMSSQSQYNLVQHFKQTLHGLRRGVGADVPFVERYPNDPHDLPQEILTRAYASESGPSPRTSSVLAATRQGIPLRSTNRALAQGGRDDVNLNSIVAKLRDMAAGADSPPAGLRLDFGRGLGGARSRSSSRMSLMEESCGGDITRDVQQLGAETVELPSLGLSPPQGRCNPPRGAALLGGVASPPQFDETCAAPSGSSGASASEGLLAHGVLPGPNRAENNTASLQEMKDRFQMALAEREADKVVIKRPAANDQTSATHKASAHQERQHCAPTKATSKKPPKVSTASKKMPSLEPDEHGRHIPFRYRGGTVYVNKQQQWFRVMARSHDRVDKRFRWGGDVKAAWQRSLDVIDTDKRPRRE